MKQLTILHNPRCSKSRQTLALLEANNIKPEIILYLENPPSPQCLKDILQKLDVPISNIIRKKEALYQEKLANITDEDIIIKTLCENPKLIERPIVYDNQKAVIGRPPENVLELIA